MTTLVITFALSSKVNTKKTLFTKATTTPNPTLPHIPIILIVSLLLTSVINKRLNKSINNYNNSNTNNNNHHLHYINTSLHFQSINTALLIIQLIKYTLVVPGSKPTLFPLSHQRNPHFIKPNTRQTKKIIFIESKLKGRLLNTLINIDINYYCYISIYILTSSAFMVQTFIFFNYLFDIISFFIYLLIFNFLFIQVILVNLTY